MTEGLIQKAFRPKITAFKQTKTKIHCDIVAEVLEKLQQEIISEIKIMTFTHASSEWIKYLTGEQEK